MNRLEKFAEHLGSADYASAYAYDKDSRTTQITFSETSGGASGKLTYAYDALGRARTRTATIGSNNYTTTYGYAAGNASLYGTNATTPLVASITQGSGANAMNFAYTYDSRGNIVSETRNGKTTTYAYDALGQLVRVNDPHDLSGGTNGTTWVYNYDRGGNITSKVRYAYATDTPGAAQQTIPYVYGDSTWKDKLTKYNGKVITYDAIGNPLNDGERSYTWGAGRQLRHISMALAGTGRGFRTTEGKHAASNTTLRISESGSSLVAKLFRGSRDITSERPANAFKWTRSSGNATADATWNSAHTGMKQVTLTEAETGDGVKYNCTYTETQGSFGTVNVNNAFTASHTPGTADANHSFSIVNGTLKVDIPGNAGNGSEYALVNNVLNVNPGFTGSITAMYEFTALTMREIDFCYDHNGLRTQKKVTENGVTTTYDYTLHGKLVTHMTKRVGNTVSDTLHFFYDAQSKPAFVKWNNILYRYVHSLQGDIVGILDANGSLVVEYKYDAWGKPISTTGSLKTSLGELNPFRYRGYVYDEESGLYYLKGRYYKSHLHRFINADSGLDTRCQNGLNLFCYGFDSPLSFADASGNYAYSTIHNAVCQQISSDNPEIVCTSYVIGISRTASGTGFIDLINPFTKEIWEVKKAPLSYDAASYQLLDYTTGIAKLGKKEYNELKVGEFISSGVAYYEDMVMPYYYVGNGVIMYETYQHHNNGSYKFVPVPSRYGTKNLGKNRSLKQINFPDDPLPKLAGGPGIIYNTVQNSDLGFALKIGAGIILGGLLGGLAGACVGSYVAI